MVYTNSKSVALLRYKPIGTSKYTLGLPSGPWSECVDNLFSVNVKETQKSDTFKLTTSLRTIHKLKTSDKSSIQLP